MADATASYVGRFAPTPSGPLHFGSLIAAVASYVDARAAGGRYLLRIEDLDHYRNRPGADDAIVRALASHGIEWDGAVVRQSARRERYAAALERLHDQGRLFYCTCSRRLLRGRRVYPGTCRERRQPPARPHAVRVRVDAGQRSFVDRLQGPTDQDLGRAVGDFVVLRRDGVVAYQLAVVVDDMAQGVTDIVRGADLLDNTPRQLFLTQVLGGAPARYAHVPVVTTRDGDKLSKHARAHALVPEHSGAAVAAALALLGHPPPGSLAHAPPSELIRWAIGAWRLDRVPPLPEIPDFAAV